MSFKPPVCNTLFWQGWHANTPNNQHFVSPHDYKPTHSQIWVGSSSLQCFHGVSCKSGCHLGNGCFICWNDYSKYNASVQEKDKAAFKGKKWEPETPSVRGPQIKADVSTTYPAFCLNFLWSKLSNLAQSHYAVCKQFLATGQGRYPRQAGAGGIQDGT